MENTEVKIFKKQKMNCENFWNAIHFHPTDAIEDDWGQRILNQVAADKAADTVRMYAMLEDIVTIDESGNLVYDFTLNDERMDYMLKKGFRLLVSYNFIPPCIARDKTETSSVSKKAVRYKGKMIVTSPPTDYSIWEEICYTYTNHIVERYGIDVVSKWYLQCYNEPDIPIFFMKNAGDGEDADRIRLSEYCKLYEAFERGVKKVSENLIMCGPALAYKLEFLEGFLNFVKEKGLKLDYVCMHNYGTSPNLINKKERPICVMNNIEKYLRCEEVVKRCFHEGKEIIVDEWGACTNGFFNRDECPELIFRETEKFSAYFAKMITRFTEENIIPKKMMICLSGQHEMTEDFSGFRNFFTLNFIKKPIYNAYVLMGKLGKNILESECKNENVSVMPTVDKTGCYAVLITYSDELFNENLPTIDAKINFESIFGKKQITVWAIDKEHTNPYSFYKKNNFEKDLTDKQIEMLREEGNLKPLKDECVSCDGTFSVNVKLTSNSVVLIEIK